MSGHSYETVASIPLVDDELRILRVRPKSSLTLPGSHRNSARIVVAIQQGDDEDRDERLVALCQTCSFNFGSVPTAALFTIHGFQHISNRANNIFYRAIWGLVFFIFATLGTYWSVNTYEHWSKHRTITVIKNTGLPISQVPFPSITICSPGLRSLDPFLKQQFQAYVLSKNPTHNFSSDSLNDTEIMSNYTRDLFPGLNDILDLDVMIKMLLSDDPNTMIQSMILTHGGYDSCAFGPVDVCPSGWTPVADDTCVINAGLGSFSDDPCPVMGGHLPRMLTLEDLQEFQDITEKLHLRQNDSFWLDFLHNLTDDNFLLYGNGTPLSNLSTDIFVEGRNESLNNISGSCIKATLRAQNLTYWKTSCDDQVRFICRMELQLCNVTLNNTFEHTFDPDAYDVSVDLLFNPIRAKDLIAYSFLANQKIKGGFDSLNKSHSFNAMFDLLWQGQIDCFDKDDNPFPSMIRQCTWLNKPVPCSYLFHKTPTDQGICCAFNYNLSEMLLDSQFKHEVIKHQDLDLKKLPVFEHRPNIVPHTGKDNGLSFVLDGNFDLLIPSSISRNAAAFSAIVDTGNQFPMTSTKRQISLLPGHENLVSLSAFKVTTDEGIQGLDPNDRQCYYENEVSLLTHRHYTRSNCLLECTLNRTYHQMSPPKCIPWNLPSRNDDTPFCDPWRVEEFYTILSNVSIDDYCQHCLPGCEEIQYSASVTAAPFRQPCDFTNIGRTTFCSMNLTPGNDFSIWGRKVTDKYKYFLSKDVQDDLTESAKDIRNPYDVDITQVFFFFDAPTIVEYARESRLTVLELIGQIGGLMGCCIGVSFISIIELIYFGVYNTFRLGYAANSKDKVFRMTRQIT